MIHVDDGSNQQQERKAAKLQTPHGIRSAAAGTTYNSRAERDLSPVLVQYRLHYYGEP